METSSTWEELQDNNGKVYYYNVNTSEKIWKTPYEGFFDRFTAQKNYEADGNSINDRNRRKLEEKEKEIRKVFSSFDESNSGKVHLTELKTICEALGTQLTSDESKKALYELDASGEFVIGLEDFVKYYLANHVELEEEDEMLKENFSTEDLWEEVENIDSDVYYYNTKTGETRWELPELIRLVRKKIKEMFPNDDVDDELDLTMKVVKLFNQYDEDNTGYLDLDQFTDFLGALGKPTGEKEAKKLMNRLNKSYDGRVSLDEFVKYWQANAPMKRRAKVADDSEWEEIDDFNGNVYYLNSVTGVKKWEKPKLSQSMMDILSSKYDNVDTQKDRFEEQLLNVWKEFDLDSNGTLDIYELGQLLGRLGQPMPMKQLKKTMGILNQKGDGKLNFEEFLAWWKNSLRKLELGDWDEVTHEDGSLYYYNIRTMKSQWETPQLSTKMDKMLDKYGKNMTLEEKIRRIFAQYDADGSGSIDVIEFSHVCSALDQTMSGDALNNAIKELDVSGDGSISVEEFMRWWKTKQNIKLNLESQEDREGKKEIFRLICEKFDTQSVGFIDLNDLSRLALALGRPLRGKSLLKALKTLDVNGDRKVKTDSFISWFVVYDKEQEEIEKDKKKKQKAIEATEEWVEKTGENGKSFYYNPRTGKKQWENPALRDRIQGILQTKFGSKNQKINRMEQIKKLFDHFDKNGTGAIDKEDFRNLTIALGYPLQKDALDAAMESLDTSGDGLVSSDEFATWWINFDRRPIAKKITDEEIKEEKIVEKEKEDKMKKQNLNKMKSTGSFKTLTGSFSLLKKNGSFFGIKRAKSIPEEILKPKDQSDKRKNLQKVIKSFKNLGKVILGKKTEDNEENDSDSLKSRDGVKSKDLVVAKELLQNRKKKEEKRIWKHIDVSDIPYDVIYCLEDLLEEVMIMSPMGAPEAAQKIQCAFRARNARKHLYMMLNDRYDRRIDAITGEAYYYNKITGEIRWDKPRLLGERDILSPRSKLKMNAERKMMMARKSFFEKNGFDKDMRSDRVFFRASALMYCDILFQINSRIKRGIWKALQNNERNLVGLIVQKRRKELEKRGPHNYLPIHWICKHDFPISTLKNLIEQKPLSVTEVDSMGHTPLHLAVRDHVSIELIFLLLGSKHGISACSAQSITGNVPLHVAAHHKANLETINALLKADASMLLIKNKKKMVPLHYLLDSFSSIDVLEAMIHADSSILEIENRNGDFPLHQAMKNHLPEEVITFILEKRRNIAFKRGQSNLLPVHLALKCKYSEHLVILLLEETLKCHVNLCTDSGYTPLHYAISMCSPLTCIQKVLECHTKSAEMKTKYGDTPLHLAARCCDESKLINHLIAAYPEAGVTKNAKQELPIHIAISYGREQVVRTLLNLCPQTYLEKIGHYDPLLQSTIVKYPNTEIVQTLLNPPTIAPKRLSCTIHDVTPFYTACCRPNTDILKDLEHFDEKSEEDMINLAKQKLRARHRHPRQSWPYDKIIRVSKENRSVDTIQMRCLCSMFKKIEKLNEAQIRQVILQHDLVREVHHILYEHIGQERIQILGKACMDRLLPTAFSITWYRHHVDQYFNR